MRRFAFFGIFVACGSAPSSTTPDAAPEAAATDASVEASTPLPTDFTSGSRLRAEVRAGGDARVFRGWFDSQLGADCAFATAEDGKLRCLPATLATVTYSDSACTQPARVSGQSPQAAPLVGMTSDACRPHAVYAGTGDVIALQNEYVLTNGGACVFTNQASWEYPTVAHVDASTFVAATIETRAIDAQVTANVLVAEDGATHVIGAHDVEHGDDCDLQSAPDGTPVCAPPLFPLQATCTGAPIAACASSPLAAVAVRTGCGYTGALTTSAIACTNAPELAGFTQGAAVDLPALTRIPLGDMRLRPMWTARGTTPIRATTFYDADLDMECDGIGSCVPVTYARASFDSGVFADAICTQPVIMDEGDCNGIAQWIQTPGGWFRRGAPLPANATIYVSQGYLDCQPRQLTQTAYATTSVPASAFATLTDSTE